MSTIQTTWLQTPSHVNSLHSIQLPDIDYTDMAKTRAEDELTQFLHSSSSSMLVVEAVPLPGSPNSLICDTSTGTQRPLVPLSWRHAVFDALHGLSHPRFRATQHLITLCFVWPGINKDIWQWTRCCLQCQRCKVHRHTHTPFSSFPSPDSRFAVVHVDLVGLSLHHEVTHVFLPVWIVSHDGQKHYLS